jgi:hypothetical protein
MELQQVNREINNNYRLRRKLMKMMSNYAGMLLHPELIVLADCYRLVEEEGNRLFERKRLILSELAIFADGLPRCDEE